MTFFYCDLETFSAVPIKNGIHAYAEQAEILLFPYAFENDAPKCWDVTEDPVMPVEIYDRLADEHITTVWHNGGGFDRIVIKHAMPEIYDLVPIERWHDTMVQAFAHGLPGSLDTLCEILKLSAEDRKLKTGRQLIQLFCKPLADNRKLRRATRHTHPEEWQQFIEYAKADIPSMRAVHKKLPTWNYSGAEMELWRLDQKINMRGFCADLDLAQAAVRAVDRAQKDLSKRTQELTAGEVQRATKRDQLLGHILAEYGVDLPDLQKSTLERRIDDPNLPWALRELLSIRLQSSSTSASKYKTLIKGASSDGRLRGTLQFDGAQRTGRWAGRLFQPQNLPRPTLTAEAINTGIEAVKADAADLIYINVIEVVSSAVRGCIVAPPGKKLAVSDLSNIEGRALAWLAGEQWKLNAFADYDRGAGYDMYILAYAKSFKVDPSVVTKDQRQKGKTQELAMGYEGGVGAFVTFALALGADLEEMAEQAYGSLPHDLRTEAEEFLDWSKRKRRSTFGLSDRAFVTCDTFKRAWRRAHPATGKFWKALESAVVDATRDPGTPYRVRDLIARRDGAWLRVQLPSGRSICYPGPRVDENDKFSYMGMNQYSRKWTRIKTYGGKLAENATQAFARDVLAYNMPRVEAAGYEIVLTVHDELITEAPDSPEFNHEHLSSLLATVPEWAPGLPLAAGGFEAYRYRKD